VVELAREVFALPVRVATPSPGLSGLVDRVATPRTTVAVGLLLYGAKQALQTGGFGAAARRSPAVDKVIGPVKRWLQDFF
jgi:cell division ATPase FtsA